MRRLKLAATAALLGLALGATPAAAATPGVLYESFSAFEIESVSLDGHTLFGDFGGHPTNIAAAGSQVYWQDGLNIWRANYDFSDAQIFHTNNFFPTNFAVDAAHNVYYESFSAIEIVAVSMTDGHVLGELGGHPTNISVGGDFVYWQDGLNIWRANTDLSGAAVFHTNNFFPTDFAVDAAHDAYYESFAGIEIGALSLSDGHLLGQVGGNPTNIAVDADGVYWQDGINILHANADLSNPTIFHTNNFFPTNFAVQSAIADPPPPPDGGGGGASGAPEPAAWALMLAGFGLAGAALRRLRFGGLAEP